MKIVVTGVAGAIGSHLAERFLSLGHEVIGIDALTPYYSPEIKKINIADIEAKGAKVYIKDLAFDNLEDALDGVDFIFHLAAQPGISASTPFSDYVNNNILATHQLLLKAKDIKNLKGFVFASTSSVYGAVASGDETTEPKPTSQYGVTKLAAEQLALSYFRSNKLPVSVLRFFSVYGERERPEKLYHKLIKAVFEERDFTIYDGSERHIRSYTYVQDIIDGCVLVLNNFDKAAGEIFNIGSDKTVTTGDGIELIQKIIGKRGKFIKLPARQGDQIETAANIQKMKVTFGYQPKFDLEEGLKKEVAWYKEKILTKEQKKVGLITRFYARNNEEYVLKLDLLQTLIEKTNNLGIFSRVDILIPVSQEFEQSDFGNSFNLLSQKKFKNVYLHKVRGDYFCTLLNYGTELHYTNNVSYTLVISSEAHEYMTEKNVSHMLSAMESGAKASGIVIDEFKDSIFDGRLINTCAMWDNWALKEVGGFDILARSKKRGEDRTFSGVEEVIPLIRMVERYGKCIAPIENLNQGKLIWPNKNIDLDKYKDFELKVRSKNIRQRHFAESIGSNIDVLKEGVMTQYKQSY